MHEKEEVRKVEKVEQVRSNAKLFAVTYYDLSLAFLSKELQGKNGFPHEYRMWKSVWVWEREIVCVCVDGILLF